MTLPAAAIGMASEWSSVADWFGSRRLAYFGFVASSAYCWSLL